MAKPKKFNIHSDKKHEMNGKPGFKVKGFQNNIKGNNVLIVNNDNKEKWYEIGLQVPRTEVATEADSKLVHTLSSEAEELLLRDVSNYNEKRSKDQRSDYQWMKTVMTQGTSSDKIAAHTVQVQDSPVHSLGILRNLIGMVRVGKKKECISAMGTLHELWISDLLIPGEKLISFDSRPLSQLSVLSGAARNECLVVWWFESNLKELYTSYIKALDALARESVDSGREKAISVMCTLLCENPEQEQLLLRQIVNKLGDPQQKVASKTMYCLSQVLDKHPNMQCVVLEEVEKMIFRSNIGHKAQYYAICFLSQFKLHTDSVELAINLIRVYFCFFKACIKKGDLDSRMLSVLLMGVNRAFPYAKDSLGEELSNHIDTLHRLVHLSPFNVALHTLCLLYQVSEASSAVGDRFYSALYKKILDPQVFSTSHQAAFLNLVFKAISNDSQLLRVQAFIKRLLQLANYSPATLACGILYLVSQVLHKKKTALSVELDSSKNVEIKFEDSLPAADDDDEEKYFDVKLEDEVVTKVDEKFNPNVPSKSSWVHRPSLTTTPGNNEKECKQKTSGYDPHQRNPLFSHADKAVYTELTFLTRHYHPTVVLFATNILQGKITQYTGDPLQDFTNSRFLERFVFKNPKKLEPEVKNNRFSRSKNYRPSGMKSLSVTSSSYLNEEERRIPCEEVYLYRYLQKKQKPWLKSENEKNEKEDDDSDADSVASDEFEQFLHGSNIGGANEDDQPDFAVDMAGEFSSGEESGSSDEEGSSKTKKGNKKLKKTRDRKRKFDDFEEEEDDDEEDMPDVFASAEEFSEMLQDTGASTLDVAGSSGLANRDNAAVKQLQWETKRDNWISDSGKHRKFKNKAKFKTSNSNKKRKTR